MREEIRIQDMRMAQILPQRRPHYLPHERMAILELRAARGWSLKQTADAFLITQATIVSWSARPDEGGPNALLQLPVHGESVIVRRWELASSHFPDNSLLFPVPILCGSLKKLLFGGVFRANSAEFGAENRINSLYFPC